MVEDELLNVLTFEYFYNGAGVGVGDFNQDGLEDLFFTSNMGESALYLNEGNFRFRDITPSSGISTIGKWATGVSVIDINQDGWPDIYLCFSGPYGASNRENELYINNGDNTFTEKANEYGLADAGYSVHAAFFDYDKDGFLDMYLLNNMTDETGPNIIRKKRNNGEMLNTDRLYRNNGNNTFSDVSAAAGITLEGYGLGVAVGDFNEDGWPDVYVSNDYLSNDILYINQRDGTFKDGAPTAFRHTSYSAMGNDVGDFNNDGKLDIITVDMLPPDNLRQKLMFGKTSHERYRSELAYGYEPQFMRNTLQLNLGLGVDSLPRFSEIGQLAGVSATDWSWSALWADLDNDGWKDLFISNGYPKDITNRDFVDFKADLMHAEQGGGALARRLFEEIGRLEGAYLPNYIFHNLGDLTFQDQTKEWGITQAAYSSGAAYADLDNDGNLDLIVTNTGSPVHIYRNNGHPKGKNNFLQIDLIGPPNNRQALGTKIFIYHEEQVQFYEHYLTRGFQSTMTDIIHIGMGEAEKVDSIQVIWPNDQAQHVNAIQANQRIQIAYQPEIEGISANHQRTTAPSFLSLMDTARFLPYIHRETYFADFNIQPLLPHKLSQGGPGIAVGDINGDGLEDYFVGGAYNQSGSLFIQHTSGSYEEQPLVAGQKFEEDMGVLFFDADSDGDLDLYVVSGGNEFKIGSTYYQDRLYSNDGRGNFKLTEGSLPANPVSGSCVIAADFDQDGDLDLFVGGRLIPQNYPSPGSSQLLENRGGKFVDVTDEKALGLRNIGMVTAALWSDWDNDGWVDLLVVGEWMPITVFKNATGKFENHTESLNLGSTRGWWNSITGADLDQDGYMDYVLGNLGTNSRYKTSIDSPLQIHQYDFDANGTEEAIISYIQAGKRYPVHPRDDIFQQIPSLRRLLPSYRSYAEVTVDELFPSDTWKKARTLSADTFYSCILRNGQGKTFTLEKLPNEAQVSPVYGVVATDVNADGKADLVLTGNSYATEVLTGNYDASYGTLLLGAESDKFIPHPTIPFAGGETKGIATLFDGTLGSIVHLVAQTDGPLHAFSGKIEYARYIRFPSEAAYALIHLDNGSLFKKEAYWGSGYLTQSGRYIAIPSDAKRVDYYTWKGDLIAGR
nr:RNA-binding protein [Cytophagales bacterium]